jgi:predicted permease
MLRGLGSDVRYVLRVLRRSPGFTLVAVLSLGLGLGANTAMYGVIRGLLLSPIPVEKPEELRLVTWRRDTDQNFSQINSTSYKDPESGINYRSNFSYPLYQAMRNALPTGTQLTAFTFLRGVSVRVGNQPALMAPIAFADGDYFTTVRPGMELGRPLMPSDDAPNASLAMVLSHSFWLRAFGGDPNAVGQIIRVNGVSAEVVGVTRAGFRGMSMGGFFPQTDLTIPLSAQPRVAPSMSSGKSLFSADDIFWLRVLARVPERSLPLASSTFMSAFRAVASPANAGNAAPALLKLMDGSRGAEPLRGESAKLLYGLNIVVALVLLIACMNLASLMLARGVSRQREMAVRKALGGSRSRLLRQSLLESLVLGAAGTMLGLLLTLWTRTALTTMLARILSRSTAGAVEVRITLDPMILLVSAALGCAATILFGLLPALRLSQLDPMAWLKQRAAGAAAPRLSLGRVLIAAQIAVTVPLVIGAALFLRTIANLSAVPLGFDPAGVAMFRLDPSYTGLPEDQYARLYQQVLANVQAIPGVRAATLMENALLSGIVSNTTVTVDGQRKELYKNAVGPMFLQTMGIRLLAGRLPGPQDSDGAPLVGAVNETAVAKLFGGRSPIGRSLRIGEKDVTIVGVVSDTRYQSQRDPTPPTLYDAALQRAGWGGHHVVLRTDAALARLEPAIREAVARVHPDLPVSNLRAQTDLIAQTNAREEVFTRLLTIFGALALLLASIGLHGVTAYSVTRRTNEIGVRVAVGAKPAQVLWLVLRQVVMLAGIGLAIGVPLSLAAGRLVRSLLFGVAPNDLLALSSAGTVLLAVALIAGMLPAWRAARLDPLVALRAD